MEQATTMHNGVLLKRWYVFESDGHRKVTWAEDEAAAIKKIQRTGFLGPDADVSNTHVEPALPMLYEAI
jgi:hypothetical protein